ncbi:SDR family NAD(P)-dependent oxidoreductase [Nocardia sp. NPDC059246]|uniref:SDR family NAD(P)-dependent oxidoreductase n=1 Tax=unclassified Nocardia TaxID=2637762 RepID=UPI0036985D6D
MTEFVDRSALVTGGARGIGAAVVAELVKAGFGVVIADLRTDAGTKLIASTAGLVGYPGISGYVASKWGLRGLTKAAALELGSSGIRVCSVHPGLIHTAMTTGLDESIAATQPLARFGEPEEVAAMVRFLVTEATFSTGSEFVVDGGATSCQAGLIETSGADQR